MWGPPPRRLSPAPASRAFATGSTPPPLSPRPAVSPRRVRSSVLLSRPTAPRPAVELGRGVPFSPPRPARPGTELGSVPDRSRRRGPSCKPGARQSRLEGRRGHRSDRGGLRACGPGRPGERSSTGMAAVGGAPVRPHSGGKGNSSPVAPVPPFLA